LTKAKLKVHLSVGALARPVAEQLQAQGLYFVPGPHALERLQSTLEALTDLYIHSFLTEAEVARARQRVFRRLSANVAPLHNPNTKSS